MSSTYSDNLKIELIGTGDQAGNWGSTTNTNLGTLIEQAISGYVTYSCTGGTDTLTMTSGASATARNMYLELTGLGGGTLVVPANKKLYYVYNSNAAAVTVKVTGLTGVSVPAGARMGLVCNGTDVVQAVNNFASPTFTGTPTAPTASAGTNTQQIATTAFVTTGLQAAYPVGSIYMSTVATNPATLFGFGTWVTYGSGRMLISQDGTYTAGSTGGSATTTLATTNLPSHSHSATSTSNTSDPGHSHNSGAGSGFLSNGGSEQLAGGNNLNFARPTTTASAVTGLSVSTTTTIGNTGSGTAFNTISPYIAVYMWNRTA